MVTCRKDGGTFRNPTNEVNQMHDMAPGMMWGMELIGVLVVVVLLLAAAALVKYLRSSNRGGDR